MENIQSAGYDLYFSGKTYAIGELMTADDFCQRLFGLEGKTAVIVGGTGVFGDAIAKGLWRFGCERSAGRAQPEGGGGSFQ